MTHLERIRAMEVKLEILQEKVDSMDEKLDDLLALKYKGAGAFLLATSLFGVSLAGLISMIITWWRN